MSKRHTLPEKEKKTLRTVLAENFQKLIAKYDKMALERFPHTAYGQKKDSDTYKKSFPQSYKRYFFKLVKNIISDKKGKKTINKRPVSLLMTAGAKQSTTKDPLIL